MIPELRTSLHASRDSFHKTGPMWERDDGDCILLQGHICRISVVVIALWQLLLKL